MNNRNAKPELLAQWMQAWTTLGRWQALNARLSREAAPLTSGWAQRSSPSFRRDAVVAASAATSW
jgi:hypothetical protein